MDQFYIQGPTTLSGEVTISGSKNSALPILFASLLASEPVEIHNIPKLQDINIAITILNQLGATVEYQDIVFADTSNITSDCVPYNLGKAIRASIWMLAPLVARFGQGKVWIPGGCAIGKRSIDLHINGLKKMGATIAIEKEYIKAIAKGRLHGAHIVMKKISVGATVTIMNAATLAIGTTIIDHAAREPEIIDIANFLIMLGANITGAGTNRIIIKGTQKLKGGKYYIIPDRIETGTFLVAAAISRSNIICLKTNPKNLQLVLMKLQESGADISSGKDWIRLNMHGKRPKSITVNTQPYPGFPTDMQAQFTLLNIISKGNGSITETIFENRFMHIPELIRMGAQIQLSNNKIICFGVDTLTGTQVTSPDLRSGACLVLAGCIAQGLTIINKIYHIDRGYENIEKKLNNIGAHIQRIKHNNTN